jgi:hypothetical protein
MNNYIRNIVLFIAIIFGSGYVHSQTVYVCTGSYAYAYHSRSDCPGLNNCKGEIRYTDAYTATYSLKRKPCCRCWSNVVNNCHDDNRSYYQSGGGGSGGAYAVLGLGIIIAASSAVILSNEVSASFSFSTDYSRLYLSPNSGKVRYGPGVTVLFRKNFKFSPKSKASIEYGFSYHALTTHYVSNNNIPYNSVGPQWAFNFNYQHQIFGNKINSDKFYLNAGPCISFSDYICAGGGVFSIAYKPHSRVKLEFRTELTNAYFQFKVGVRFLYQKYYFWQKKKGRFIDYEQ